MYNTTVHNYDQTCFTHRIIYQNCFFSGISYRITWYALHCKI